MSLRPHPSRKRPLPSVREGTIPVKVLESYGKNWLPDCELRQLSAQTRSTRGLILEKLGWYLRTHEHGSCHQGTTAAPSSNPPIARIGGREALSFSSHPH